MPPTQASSRCKFATWISSHSEAVDGGSTRQDRAAGVWRDPPARLVVGRTDDRVHGLRRLCCVCDVGGVPERALHLRPVSFPVLLARAVGILSPRVVRTETGLVAGARAVLAGAADPAVPRSVSLHLLLLPRCLLQGVLDGPGVVHGG